MDRRLKIQGEVSKVKTRNHKSIFQVIRYYELSIILNKILTHNVLYQIYQFKFVWEQNVIHKDLQILVHIDRNYNYCYDFVAIERSIQIFWREFQQYIMRNPLPSFTYSIEICENLDFTGGEKYVLWNPLSLELFTNVKFFVKDVTQDICIIKLY